MPAKVGLSLGDALVLPRWPVVLRWLGQGLAFAALLVGVAWCASILWHAGHVGAFLGQAILAIMMLAVCAVAPWRWWRQRPADSSLPLWWHADWLRASPEDVRWGALAGSHWRDRHGEPVVLSVVFDLGPFLLLRTSKQQGDVTIHWVNEGLLSGPWRWRVIRSSPDHALVASFPSSQLASSSLLIPNRPAPKASRPSSQGDTDFAPTQVMEQGDGPTRAGWRGLQA